MKTKTNINELRDTLPHGAIKVIAQNASVSTVTVKNVLQGDSQNMRVKEEIANYLFEMRQKEKAIAEKIKDALN